MYPEVHCKNRLPYQTMDLLNIVRLQNKSKMSNMISFDVFLTIK